MEITRKSEEAGKDIHAFHDEHGGQDIASSDQSLPEVEDKVTFKTWVVVVVLALSYGLSNWQVPTIAAIIPEVAGQMGDAAQATWYISSYIMAAAIAFLICGANSDLFGRRWFLVGADVFLFVGSILCATANNNKQMIAGWAIFGFGAGNAQLAAFALPELLPNKHRHIGVIIADLGTFFSLIVGPVVARFAIRHGQAWRWLLYAPAIGSVVSGVLLYLLYFPPRHPRGIPFRIAIRQLDYVGGALFIVAASLILTGIVYTTILGASSTKVIGTLVIGFVTLVAFGTWETLAPLTWNPQPLTPTRIFTKHKGREFTAPFIAGFVVTMFYFGTNVIWPTMIATLFTPDPENYMEAIYLSLPQGLGMATGGIALSVFGGKIGHWKWTLTGSVFIMVLFGGLLAIVTPERKIFAVCCIFFSQIGYGWSQYLSITYIQFGVDQHDLGIGGGLAGVARDSGGAIAVSVFSTILGNTQRKWANRLLPVAVIAAGLPESSVPAVFEALPAGAAALMAIPGMNSTIAAAAGNAWQHSYVHGLSVTTCSSVAFGGVCIIACLFCLDISPKMTNKIEVFLENTENANKNEFYDKNDKSVMSASS